MYVPEHFRVQDRAVLFEFIERYSFATLITQVGCAPFASHVPLLLDRERDRLLGHVARANPHWRSFDGQAQALAIFAGPHAYISPTWYVTTPNVPTWNYAVVHVYGAPRVLAGETELAGILDLLLAKYESTREQPWANDLADDYRAKFHKAIVAFEMPMARLEGKFKFGQNREAADRQSMLQHLAQGDAQAQMLAELIRQHLRE
ncbi:MAG: FMN-binding negative transcriptional regulator [Gemmataceae bacterium]|nr:FMN-binding negative transcriptional regulator [Gemmataceae bacterium]